MTITVKGQVTIPQALRERFALLPGTEVEFVVADDAQSEGHLPVL
jgi:AbrB family looped-hinge helix DNA binding protein